MAPKFQKGPDLKRFMDKRMQFVINANRRVVGTLRGYDAFLNVVLEDAQWVTTTTKDGGGVHPEQQQHMGQVVIRGNSIIQFEGLERIATTTTTTTE